MWNVWSWAVASNERAVANARAASVECSRRRLEAAEVQEYLQRRYAPHGVPAAVQGEALVGQR